MKAPDFVLQRPDRLEEALALLAEVGSDGKVLAGGQSLLPLLNFRLAAPECLVDLTTVAGLSEIEEVDGAVRFGATVRQVAAERWTGLARACPLMASALPRIGHPAIRSRGTVGGSLAHADPAAELPAVAAALDATFVAASTAGIRRIPASEFFQGFLTTALRPEEALIGVEFPTPQPNTAAKVFEVARRHGDFALVGLVLQLTTGSEGVIDDVRICFTGVADVPRRCRDLEDDLRGQKITPDVARTAAQQVRGQLDPPGDLHASSAYRAGVAGTLLERGLRSLSGEPLPWTTHSNGER